MRLNFRHINRGSVLNSISGKRNIVASFRKNAKSSLIGSNTGSFYKTSIAVL